MDITLEQARADKILVTLIRFSKSQEDLIC